MKRSGRGPSVCLEGLRDRKSTSQDSKPGPPEYEAGSTATPVPAAVLPVG